MPSVVSRADRLARLDDFCGARYRDVAIRLRYAETGELGPVYGGRWHVHEGRYLAPWELRYQEMSAVTDEEVEASRLRVVIHGAHARQAELAEDTTTSVLLGIGSRRGGKSFASAIKAGIMAAHLPTVDGEIISPTFEKSAIMWRYVHAVMPPDWIAAENYQQHWIELQTGVRIKFLSTHRPDSVIGEGVGWIGFDELQSVKEIAWSLALPAASDGGAQFQIWGNGTPRPGEFRARYERIRKLEEKGLARIIRYTYRDNVFIDSGDGTIFDLASALIDPRRRRQELDAEFVTEEGLVYYRFDRATHDKSWTTLQRVREPAWAEDVTGTWLPREIESGIIPKFLVGVDYGINRNFAVVYKVVRVHGVIALWAVAEAYGDQDYDIDALASELVARGFYPSIICDDASGAKTTAGHRSQFRFENVLVGGRRGFEVHHFGRNPPVSDRVDAMNALMGNSLNQVRWYVDVDKCPRLVECIENQEMLKGKPRRSWSHEVGYHDMPDAAGYPAIYLFPAAVPYEREERAAA